MDLRESGNFDLSAFETRNMDLKVSYQKHVELEGRVLYSREEIVKTISPHWLHISTLRDAYPYNNDYLKNIQELSGQFAGWKRVRGDGNCYYRSVISTFFLKIFHFNQNPNRILEFIRNIIKFESKATDPYKASISYIRNIINNLYSRINSNVFPSKVSIFQEVLELLQDDNFDLKLIEFGRTLSYLTLISEAGEDLRCFLIDDAYESTINHMLTLGNEAEGVELSLLPLSLGIEVQQINLLGGKIMTNIFPEATKDQIKLKVHIISKSKGHYDALYSIQEMEDDDYNMKLGKYMIPLSN
jgi:ubiquitin thioesterase protein OTUB1